MNTQSSKFVPSYGASRQQNDQHSKATQNLSKAATSKANVSSCLGGPETDATTSTENLSMEERYYIKHNARQEPQGQEKQEIPDGLQLHSARQLSLDNASSYNTLIIHASGDDGLDPWASLSPSRLSSLRDSYISAASSQSKTTSFPSSSASSSPTLSNATQGQTREINEIPDDYLSQSHVLKHLAKEMKVVTPDLKDENDANLPRRLLLLDLSPRTQSRIIDHRYSTPVHTTTPLDVQGKFSLSRSQPDLTQLVAAKAAQDRSQAASMYRQTTKTKPSSNKAELVWPASEMIQLLVKENSMLKQELEICFRKVAKSQKLEDDVTNIHRSHQELMQSSERREKLERAARQRLQDDNRMLRQQYELLLSQIESPMSGIPANATDEILMLKREIGKRDTMLAQLIAQNKELTGCRERQEIELAAQRATLQEQRTHIEILDAALTNAQTNVVRLEEECQKRQLYEERVVQLQQNLSSLQMARDKLEGEISDLRHLRRVNNVPAQTPMYTDVRTNGKGDSSEFQDLILKVHERDKRVAALETDVERWQQWYLEENAMRQTAIDAAGIPKDAKIAALEKTSQESERIMAEARTDKIRQMDELHAAQRRLADVEGRARELESKLAEKEAMIKVLQQQHRAISMGGSVLSRSPHPHMHHSSSSFHQQPSPSPISISNSVLLSSLTSKANTLACDLGATSISSTATIGSYPRGLCSIRPSSAGLGYRRSSSAVADYGTSSGPPSTVSSSSPLVNSEKNTTASMSRSYSDDAKSFDEQIQGLDSQIMSGRTLCCFSGLYNRGIAARKEGLSQPLLVGLKRRPPHSHNKDDYTMMDSRDRSVAKDGPASTSTLYSRYKSASPTTKQFHSRYSPNPTGSLPPTPPPNDNLMYFMQRLSNKSSLPPTPPSTSSKESFFHFNPASLPPTPPPLSSEERHHKSSSLHVTAKSNHEILLLEKQGRASQKQRRSSAGSQVSSDDLNSSRAFLASATPHPESQTMESSCSATARKGRYDKSEKSSSKESLNSSLPNSNVADKLRHFQQSSKNSSSLSSSSREKLSAGRNYRIQL